VKTAKFKEAYQSSFLFGFIEKFSGLAQNNIIFRQREYFRGRKYEYPEILENSRVFRPGWNMVEKILPKKGGSFFSSLALALFFLIFLFIPIKSWLKNTYPVEDLYTFIVPVALIVIAVLMFLRGRAKKSESINLTLADLGVLFLIFSLIISSIMSLLAYGQVKNIYYEGFIWLSYFAIFYIGRLIFIAKKALIVFLTFNLGVAFVLSVIGVGQYFWGVATPQWIEGYESIGTRVFSTLDNPIIFSGYINIFFFIALGVFFGIKKARYRILMTPLFIVLFTALVLTFSRGGWIGFIVGIILFFFIYNPKYILGLVSVSLLSIFLLPREYFYRFLAIFDSRYSDISAVSGRIWTLNNVVHILPQHLLFGVGPGMYGGEVAFKTSPSIVYMEGIQGGAVPMQNTDNQFLQVLIQQGIVGILVFLFFIGVSIYIGLIIYGRLKDRFLKMLSLGITSALAVFFIQGLFTDILQFPQMSLIMFGFLGILLSLPKIRKKSY